DHLRPPLRRHARARPDLFSAPSRRGLGGVTRGGARTRPLPRLRRFRRQPRSADRCPRRLVRGPDLLPARRIRGRGDLKACESIAGPTAGAPESPLAALRLLDVAPGSRCYPPVDLSGSSHPPKLHPERDPCPSTP